MTPKTLCVMLLVLSVCLSIHSHAVKFPHGKHWNCCETAIRRDLSAEVTGNTYKVQHAKNKCVNAIKFKTRDGQTLCAHPDEQWVKNLMAGMTNKP
ncbi:regakine-1 [Oryzias latipes]|uniref:regakine-1 n=1 Tax=Oryzias latipes TaxID=8090 RepID=UPI0005CC6095|nr:regakine-1 [Oryzias latipes]